MLSVLLMALTAGCATTKTPPADPKILIKDLQTQILRMTFSTDEDYTNVKERYNEYVAGLKEGVVMTDMDGNILDANTSYMNMFDYTLSQLQSNSSDYLTPDQWYRMENDQFSLAQTKDFVTFEKDYKTKDGHILSAIITGWVVKDTDGKVIGTGALVREKTNIPVLMP